MNKLKLFLMADGIFVAGGIVLFLVLYLRRGRDSQFKDDLWKEQKRKQIETQKRAAEDQVDKKILLEHRPDPKDPEERASPRQPEFKVPNFHGRPHEILGIEQGADRERVMRAYKHWIKRYHPDRVTHLGQKYVDQARRRAEQLNSARDELLRPKGK